MSSFICFNISSPISTSCMFYVHAKYVIVKKKKELTTK